MSSEKMVSSIDKKLPIPEVWDNGMNVVNICIQFDRALEHHSPFIDFWRTQIYREMVSAYSHFNSEILLKNKTPENTPWRKSFLELGQELFKAGSNVVVDPGHLELFLMKLTILHDMAHGLEDKGRYEDREFREYLLGLPLKEGITPKVRRAISRNSCFGEAYTREKIVPIFLLAGTEGLYASLEAIFAGYLPVYFYCAPSDIFEDGRLMDTMYRNYGRMLSRVVNLRDKAPALFQSYKELYNKVLATVQERKMPVEWFKRSILGLFFLVARTGFYPIPGTTYADTHTLIEKYTVSSRVCRLYKPAEGFLGLPDEEKAIINSAVREVIDLIGPSQEIGYDIAYDKAEPWKSAVGLQRVLVDLESISFPWQHNSLGIRKSDYTPTKASSLLQGTRRGKANAKFFEEQSTVLRDWSAGIAIVKILADSDVIAKNCSEALRHQVEDKMHTLMKEALNNFGPIIEKGKTYSAVKEKFELLKLQVTAICLQRNPVAGTRACLELLLMKLSIMRDIAHDNARETYYGQDSSVAFSQLLLSSPLGDGITPALRQAISENSNFGEIYRNALNILPIFLPGRVGLYASLAGIFAGYLPVSFEMAPKLPFGDGLIDAMYHSYRRLSHVVALRDNAPAVFEQYREIYKQLSTGVKTNAVQKNMLMLAFLVCRTGFYPIPETNCENLDKVIATYSTSNPDKLRNAACGAYILSAAEKSIANKSVEGMIDFIKPLREVGYCIPFEEQQPWKSAPALRAALFDLAGSFQKCYPFVQYSAVSIPGNAAQSEYTVEYTPPPGIVMSNNI